MQSVFYGQHRSLVGSRIYGVEQVLIARTIGVLERHADASFARLALSDRNGTYAGVSENDPAIVSLRTWHRKLDLHGVDTQLTGEFAYPIVSRGRLVGVLLVGPKRSQESRLRALHFQRRLRAGRAEGAASSHHRRVFIAALGIRAKVNS